MAIFNFIQTQVFGMLWLSQLCGSVVSFFGLDLTSPLGASVHFFLYDVIKITILLCVLIFIISFIQTYFPPERARSILSKTNGFFAKIIAALLGTVTPFCSCSSIPLFIGFTSARLPIGVTFSFLISSPMVDLGSLVLLSSIFGVKVALVYTILGLIIAILGGYIIEKLKLDHYVENFIYQASLGTSTAKNSTACACASTNTPQILLKERLSFSLQQTTDTFKKVIIYILIGVGIGAAIHNSIPNSLIEEILGQNNPFSVIYATLAGIPIYADIFGTIPIAEVLLQKGASLGTVLSLMMAVTTLSLPSLIMLRKAIKLPLLLIFVGICTLGIIICGYIFNLLHPWLVA